MNTEIKRPNYFRAQFLVEEDFQDEQAYHSNLRQQHLLSLHGWGVVGDGLQITNDDRNITISPGVAVDQTGREIVLTNAQTITLPEGDGPLILSIRYGEFLAESDRYTGPGADALNTYTRITETPSFVFGTPGDDDIPLARINLSQNPPIDESVRQFASAAIAPGAIVTTQLADGVVTTAKLNDNAITRAKIGNSAVGNAQIGNNAVNTAKIEDNAITTAKIADNAVNAAKLQLAIPQQNRPTKRYYAPLIPTPSTQLNNPVPDYLYAGGTGLVLRQIGTTVLWLDIPHGSLMTNFGAVVRDPGNTTFGLQLSLLRFNKEHLPNTIQTLSFTSSSERASNINLEVNNEFFYGVFVNYQHLSQTSVIIQSVYIDYQPTRLF